MNSEPSKEPGEPPNSDLRPPTSDLAAPTSDRRSRLRPLLWLPVAYLCIVVVMMFLENTFIFFPTRYPGGDWEPLGIQPEDAWFQADDGTRLHGWYLAHPNPRGVVLFCHGNAGNITHRAGTLQMLRERVGASVLLFDYRGYGRSEGKPSEAGLYQDARAAREWLAKREGIEPSQIVLMGRSLGGAVAVELATDGAKALVLESTFTSIPDVAAHYYPWLPVRLIMRNRFDSAAKIGKYRGPLLQSHGDADTIIPYRFGQRLFEAANEPKQFVTIEGRDHNDSQSQGYYDKLIALLDGLD